MSAPQKRARATTCQSSGSRGNRESHFTQPLVQLLWNLRDTPLFETEGGEKVAFRDRLRQTRADPDAEQTFPSCRVSSRVRSGTYRLRWGLASKTCPRSLSNSPTSVLASTTNRKPLAACALAPPLPRRVGDELLDQFLFRKASRAAKL
jgi:hypothetical protein